MEFIQVLKDKTIKGKEKTELISQQILSETIGIDELFSQFGNLKDPEIATCIEALEYATKINPAIATENSLNHLIETLLHKAPRIKWESAKVIGNIIHKYPEKIDIAVNNLLKNTEDSGTVVRWSAAFALGQILLLKTKHNHDLIPKINAIIEREEKNSIKKIYQTALKKNQK